MNTEIQQYSKSHPQNQKHQRDEKHMTITTRRTTSKKVLVVDLSFFVELLYQWNT